jgi:hypothetical protein
MKNDGDFQEHLDAAAEQFRRDSSLLDELWHELHARSGESFAVSAEDLSQLEEASAQQPRRINSHIVNAVRC